MAGALSFRHASRLNPAAVPPTGWRATHRPARPSRQPGASAAARQCMHTAWAATWQRPSKEAEGVIRRLPLLGTYGRFESWAAFRKSLNLLERETRLELATSTLARLRDPKKINDIVGQIGTSRTIQINGLPLRA